MSLNLLKTLRSFPRLRMGPRVTPCWEEETSVICPSRLSDFPLLSLLQLHWLLHSSLKPGMFLPQGLSTSVPLAVAVPADRCMAHSFASQVTFS